MTEPKHPASMRLSNISVTSVSLVDSCPYCGGKFDEENKRTPTGKPCSHPTKLQKLEVKGLDEVGRTVTATLSDPPPCKVCGSEEHGHISVGPFEIACPLDVKLDGGFVGKPE